MPPCPTLQMQQKQVVEDMLAGELPLTSLQAPLFMEDFWRGRYRADSEWERAGGGVRRRGACS